MSPSQDQIKAWWFDRLSDLAAQNMALLAEVDALRAQATTANEAKVYKPNGKDDAAPSAHDNKGMT